MTTKDADEIRRIVRERYGARARQELASCCAPQTGEANCCGPSTAASEKATHAESLYSREELAVLPESVSDMALGCGNPVALAELKPGEVVVDLGSGGGIDCFLASARVGPQGRVIGIDMTPEMIWLARENATKMEASNVEFRLGEMEHIPVDSCSADIIISNCVINLSPDKDAVFNEAWRVLKPGGRICVSDIVLKGELPPDVKENLDQWAACIAGAIHLEEYVGKIKAAAFTQVNVQDRATQARDSSTRKERPEWWNVIASVRLTAFKPL
jgi:SAM-dependent methyltransferase